MLRDTKLLVCYIQDSVRITYEKQGLFFDIPQNFHNSRPQLDFIFCLLEANNRLVCQNKTMVKFLNPHPLPFSS